MDQSLKVKQGDERSDGKVFWSRNKQTGFQYWVSKEKFDELRKSKNERLKIWRDKNRDKVKKQAKAYREKNADRNNELKRIWAQTNRFRFSEKLRNWKKDNKARCCFVEERRRARKKNQTPNDSWEEVVLSFYQISERISKCLGIKHAVDHIHPLSKGGSHCHRNLQVLPFSINSKKLARLDVKLPDCYRTKGFRYKPPEAIKP